MRANDILGELEFSDFTFTAFEGRYFKKYETKNATSLKLSLKYNKILNNYSQKSIYGFTILRPGLPPTTIRPRIKNRLKRISKNISSIAAELKINQAEKISFNWVRHTFATTLKRSGISTEVMRP